MEEVQYEMKRIAEYEEELNTRKKMLELENKLMKIKKELKKDLNKEDYERVEELKKRILNDEGNLHMLKKEVIEKAQRLMRRLQENLNETKKENNLKNRKQRQQDQESKFLFLFLKK